MKKLFALMLALMLALAGVSSVSAEDAAAPEAAAASSGTIHLKVSLNADSIAALAGAADENAAKMIPAIIDLVNNLDIAMTSDGKDAELILSLKEEPVLNLGVLKEESRMLLLSNLFPNTALVIDQAAMAGMAGGMSGSETSAAAAGFTMPQISLSEEQTSAMMAPITKLMEDLQSKLGEPEAVEEAMYGATFTVKIPVNMTTKELLQMVLPAVKEVVSQEGFASVMEQMKAYGMNVDFSAETIDQKIDELSNTKDEDLPALDLAIYSNEAGDSMFVVLVTGKDQTVTVNSGTVAGQPVVEVDVKDKYHFFMQGAEDKMAMNMQFVPQEGLLVDIDGEFKAAAEGFSAVFNVKMNDAELGTLTLDGTPNGVLSGTYTAEGKTEVSIADLQDQASEQMKTFMTDIQMGMMAVMAKAATALPSFMTLMQQMMPQTEAEPQK